MCLWIQKQQLCDRKWGIENDDFHITYENDDHLLGAFHEEISYKKSNQQYAANFRNHVKAILPACGLGSQVPVKYGTNIQPSKERWEWSIQLKSKIYCFRNAVRSFGMFH